MPNPLFNALNGNRQAQSFNPQQMMADLQAFRKNFKGSPREQVQHLLNTGAMTQTQFNQLTERANQIMRMLPLK